MTGSTHGIIFNINPPKNAKNRIVISDAGAADDTFVVDGELMGKSTSTALGAEESSLPTKIPSR
jgi:hypothetical protein